MDNLTHSLIGAAVSQLSLPLMKPRGRERSIAVPTVLTALFGNNIPDGDVFFALFFENQRMANLLQHRGMTHTFALAPLLGLISAFLAVGIWRYFNHDARLSLRQKYWLAAVGILSVCLHIAADFSNDYGIHPFWPLFNGWVYGDVLFIIEPLIWFALLPLIVLGTPTASRKLDLMRWSAFGFCAFAAFSLVWFYPTLDWRVKLWTTAAAALVWGVTWLTRSAWPGLGVALVTVLTFAFCSQKAKNHARALVPGEAVVVDTAAAPSPGNPFCWRVIVNWQTAERIHASFGWVSLWPSLFEPRGCYARPLVERSAPLVATPLKNSEAVVWDGDHLQLRSHFERLIAKNCLFERYLHFSRMPFLRHEVQQGEPAVLFGDLRYDFESGLGFSEFLVPEDISDCETYSAPWVTPFAASLK